MLSKADPINKRGERVEGELDREAGYVYRMVVGKRSFTLPHV